MVNYWYLTPVSYAFRMPATWVRSTYGSNGSAALDRSFFRADFLCGENKPAEFVVDEHISLRCVVEERALVVSQCKHDIM